MIEVIFNSEVRCPFVKKDILPIINSVAKKEKKISGILEVTVVSKPTIKKLNKKFRGKNSITDVLSFSMVEGKVSIGPVLGEIYICYEQIIKQAKEFGVTSREEFNRMLVHGLLHLVGYDHVKDLDANKMFALQEKILSQVK